MKNALIHAVCATAWVSLFAVLMVGAGWLISSDRIAAGLVCFVTGIFVVALGFSATGEGLL